MPVPLDADIRRDLEEIDFRLRVVLPEDYQETYETLEPKPMRSAGLVYGEDGRVAWDRIWRSFCDLALAGGPPHRGSLLRPATPSEETDVRYRGVVEEICRGVRLVTGLRAYESPVRGWVQVDCHTEEMAGWLLRALTAENIAARAEGLALALPAGPDFRVDKEIKNVVTSIAKTCHYWLDHMPPAQHGAIADLFVTLSREAPLIEPAWTSHRAEIDTLANAAADSIRRETGLPVEQRRAPDALGVACGSVRTAIWMMRALIVGNVLARREDRTVLVPLDAARDPDGTRVATAVIHVHRLAVADETLSP